MINDSWDPLQSSAEADSEIISAAQKRQIQNILKSYVGMYDSFSELIQNAMDAVDRRASKEDNGKYTKKLWLKIDLSDNSFTIVDNGVGFNEKEFRSFLAPNISFKNGGSTRGNKGVGATYIAYGFDDLKFGTKVSEHSFSGQLRGGRTWVEDTNGIVTRPVVEQVKANSDKFESIDRGSFFQIKFGGEKTRPKDLSWYSATTPEQWLYLLLVKTPLGSIESVNTVDQAPIVFDLEVVDKKGDSRTINNESAKYIFPHSKINNSVDLKEVIQYQSKLASQGKDASELPRKYFKSNGIYEFFTTEDIKSLRNDFSNHDALDDYRVEAYGYFSYSTSVWDQLNDKMAKLRKGYRVLRGGLQIANNNMIQGELITIPLTSNIGYQKQCHVIVHLKDADPDLGRKGFQPELQELAESISVAIVNKFKKWKKLLKSDTGTTPEIEKELDLHQWIRAQEEHENTHPLNLTNEHFFKPINEISITSEPQSEQDVIVLFNQLVAGGVIRGINLLATSQIMQYDGVFKFIVKEPFSNHHFDKETNPLGVEEFKFNKEYTSPPKVLEYKYNLDALIHEFESDYKNEKDIHLAIAWEMGNEWKKNYEITPLLDLENLHQREFHGLTHTLHSGYTRFEVIILKELMEYLNNVDAVQQYQKDTYGDDIF